MPNLKIEPLVFPCIGSKFALPFDVTATCPRCEEEIYFGDRVDAEALELEAKPILEKAGKDFSAYFAKGEFSLDQIMLGQPCIIPLSHWCDDGMEEETTWEEIIQLDLKVQPINFRFPSMEG